MDETSHMSHDLKTLGCQSSKKTKKEKAFVWIGKAHGEYKDRLRRKCFEFTINWIFGPLRCEGQWQIKCVPHKEKDKSFEKPSSKHVPRSKCTQMVLKSLKEHFKIMV